MVLIKSFVSSKVTTEVLEEMKLTNCSVSTLANRTSALRSRSDSSCTSQAYRLSEVLKSSLYRASS